MGNTNETLIHIPKLRAGQYFFLFHIRYYLKISLIYNKFWKLRRGLLWQKKNIGKKNQKFEN